MGKIVTSLSVDYDLFNKAKKVIPNLSAFFEECLRKKVFANGDPKEIQEQIEQLNEQLALAKEGLQLAEKNEVSAIGQATETCLLQLISRGKIPTKTLEYWAEHAGITSKELLEIVMEKTKG